MLVLEHDAPRVTAHLFSIFADAPPPFFSRCSCRRFTGKEPRSLKDGVAKEWVRYNKSYEKFQKMNPIEHFKQTGKLYDYKPSYSK